MIKCNKDSRQLPEAILSIWTILDKKNKNRYCFTATNDREKGNIVNSLTELGASGQLSLDSFETKSLKKYYKYHNKLSFTPLLYLP